jgi:hypothetical protein
VKLGIAVVYLFGEQNEPLLALHLRLIDKYTQVPYTIYGSVNRLAAPYREQLARYPRVQVCELPATDLRGGEEHAHYLDQLAGIAVDDGATHVVTLHLDSFPVRSGWAEELAGKLSASCAFATIERIQTACLLLGRDWYLRCRPTFRLSAAQRASPRYLQFVTERDPGEHSGIGYGYAAYLNGQSWYSLPNPAKGSASSWGQVHGDMVFHLHGAIRLGEQKAGSRSVLSRTPYARLTRRVAAIARRVTPVPSRWFLRSRLKTILYQTMDQPRLHVQAQAVDEIRRQLLADPEAYLMKARGKASNGFGVVDD